MKSTKEQFDNLFQSTFTQEKLQSDFNWCLKKSFAQENDGFIIPLYNQDTEFFERNIVLKLGEIITILSYTCIFRFGTDMHFNIFVAIGEYIKSINENALDFYQVDKCVARFRYNHDLSLMDIEFYTPPRVKPFKKLKK